MLRRLASQPFVASISPYGGQYLLPHTCLRAISSPSSPVSQQDEQLRKALASKLLYRSKQRGFLELDLLVGLWAEREIPKMDINTLQSLGVVLDQENPDLFKWLTGQLPPPAAMQDNAAFRSLKASAAEQLSQLSPPASRASAGQEWVRGWDDSWKGKGAASGTVGTGSAAGTSQQQ